MSPWEPVTIDHDADRAKTAQALLESRQLSDEEIAASHAEVLEAISAEFLVPVIECIIWIHGLKGESATAKAWHAHCVAYAELRQRLCPEHLQ